MRSAGAGDARNARAGPRLPAGRDQDARPETQKEPAHILRSTLDSFIIPSQGRAPPCCQLTLWQLGVAGGVVERGLRAHYPPLPRQLRHKCKPSFSEIAV